MLLFDPIAQSLVIEFLGFDKMPVIGRSPMQHAPALVHDCINYRVSGPAILGLNVEYLAADLNVGIES